MPIVTVVGFRMVSAKEQSHAGPADRWNMGKSSKLHKSNAPARPHVELASTDVDAMDTNASHAVALRGVLI
jgi:hypothetical protein